MFRFAQWSMMLGFMIALILWWTAWLGAWPAIYAVGILLTGTFALWGIKRVRR